MNKEPDIAPETMLFPRCGITYADVLTCRGLSMAKAAARLGVERTHFSLKMKNLRLQKLFSGCNRYRHRTEVFPDIGVTVEDIESCRGMLQIDAATELGVSPDWFNRRINRDPDLRALFPAKGGEAQKITKRGYANL